jgi:hypothetical protein
VGEMPARREVESHDTIVWAEKCGVDGEVRWRSTVRLDVDAPLSRIAAICLKRSGHAEVFDLIDVLVTTVISLSRVACGIAKRTK